MRTQKPPLKFVEFVTLLATMISILALSIDAMLPALGEIGRDLGVQNPNDVQLVITAMILGFGVGQIAAGPLSDSFGRKPVIYFGYAIFMAGCILSIFASDFTLMLLGRVLQGLGAAAPRIVGIALVRDDYEGRAMARIMSFVMAVFILVPAVAPAIGQGIMLVSHWRFIFVSLLVVAILAFMWFAIRQPETLHETSRRKFSLKNIMGGIREALSYRSVTGYTIASGVIFGSFLGYLTSAQQIFQDVYATGQWFSIYFGIAALSIGAASIFNSRLVMKFGMRYLTWRALFGVTGLSLLFSAFVVLQDGIPDFWFFMAWLLANFFCIGIIFGNFNALAMEDIGHMAGLGAAVFGSLSTFVAIPLGWTIGAQFNGTVIPLVTGFGLLGALSLSVMWWTEKEM